MPSVSVIICSNNSEKTAASESLYKYALAGEDFEFIVEENARSMAEGYNRGMAKAKGDTLILSHNDAGPLRPGVGVKLRRYLRDYDIVGGCGTQRLCGPQWLGQSCPPHVHGQVLNVLPPQPHLGFDIMVGPQGFLLANIKPGSVAEKSGLQNGDILSHVHHTLIEDPGQFAKLVNESLAARKTVNFGYSRAGGGTQKAFLDFTGGVQMQQAFNLSVFGVYKPITGDIQALDGFFMACRGNLKHYFDEEMCDTFHMYDIDWSYRAYLKGARIAVANDLWLGHASVGGYGDPKWKAAADKWMAEWGPRLPKPTQVQGQYMLTSMMFPTLDEGVLMMQELVELTR